MKTLLIVESPAKCKTIEKLLGSNYIVLSSFGHIRNLDSKSLGVDIENNFEPKYEILSDRNKQIKAIRETIKNVNKVLLASDEDREGEAIAWHCAVVFKLNINEKNRICFHEITKSALENAVSNPRTINMEMVYSQQTRRILDRIVGFKLSPLLWKYIAPKLSAGRVQSVALKIICDQEKDILSFQQKKYYKTIGLFNKDINATLNKDYIEEKEILIFLEHCKSCIFTIKSIIKKKSEKNPPPPYITSTIQQDASVRFNISSKKIMSILQKLYENGFITYHRTDSTIISTVILEEIKEYINKNYGDKYLHLRSYRSKVKCAQEAHEAIRPTDINRTNIDNIVNNFDEIDKKIYNLIWKRTMASQMSASIADIYTISISISNRIELFISTLQKLIFDGYKIIYDDIVEEGKEEDSKNIPNFIVDTIKENEILTYDKITSTEKYQNAPPRYTESSLIKKMEKNGVGRPSTYASIIETIIERKYVEKKDVIGKKIDTLSYFLEKTKVIKVKKETITHGGEKKKLVPSDIGMNTNQFLENNFENILNIHFTSSLEEELDEIVNSNKIWKDVIHNFYDNFIPNVNKLNEKENIIKNNNEKKRFLGNNEKEEPVYAYIGKYGPVLQIGSEKNIRYMKIDSSYSVNTITLEDMKKIEIYPKNIGKYEDKDIFIKKGMYGFYISYNDINYKITDNFDENIDLENAIEIIKNIGSKDNFEKVIDKYKIKNGPYGYYILFNKKFYSIPKEYDIDLLDKEKCDTIIKIPKKKFIKK